MTKYELFKIGRMMLANLFSILMFLVLIMLAYHLYQYLPFKFTNIPEYPRE